MIRAVNEKVIRDDQVAIWFLGSASFIIKINGKTIYLDPYFSDRCEEISQE